MNANMNFAGFFSARSHFPWLVILLLIATAACSKGSSGAGAEIEKPAITASTLTPESAPSVEAAPDSAPLRKIDSKRAFQYLKEIVAFGPRPIGSENHRKLENYITSHLKGD